MKDNGTGIIVFARLDSSRLPGKALRLIAGRPMLGRVFDRLRKVSASAQIVLATTDRLLDDPLAAFAAGEGISVFRGAVNDVAGRALACMDFFNFERCVRICGDSPFIDPMLVDELIRIHDETNADIVTNVLVRTYPPGLSVEVVTRAALLRVVSEARDLDDREHMTRYIYRQAKKFHIVDKQVPYGQFGDVRLVVDTIDDLEFADLVMQSLGQVPEDASLDEIVRCACVVSRSLRVGNEK